MTALTFGLHPLKEWIVRRSIDASRNQYELWPGYSDTLLTLEELIDALAECSTRWPKYTFSGHKVDLRSSKASRRRPSSKVEVLTAPPKRHSPRPDKRRYAPNVPIRAAKSVSFYP